MWLESLGGVESRNQPPSLALSLAVYQINRYTHTFRNANQMLITTCKHLCEILLVFVPNKQINISGFITSYELCTLFVCFHFPAFQFLTVEEPVRRVCRTVSLTDPSVVVRGFQFLPPSVDFGTLQEGTSSAITVVMKNVGVDMCRYSMQKMDEGNKIS